METNQSLNINTTDESQLINYQNQNDSNMNIKNSVNISKNKNKEQI